MALATESTPPRAPIDGPNRAPRISLEAANPDDMLDRAQRSHRVRTAVEIALLGALLVALFLLIR